MQESKWELKNVESLVNPGPAGFGYALPVQIV